MSSVVEPIHRSTQLLQSNRDTSMNLPPVVFAVGYSVRALVEACTQSSLKCVAVDHFGDADTRALSEDRWIPFQMNDELQIARETMLAIEAAKERFCQDNQPLFLLAGGMENLGEAVDQLRCIGTVWGPTESQRMQLRDCRYLKNMALALGIAFPQIQFEHDPAQSDDLPSENWLWKPVRSAGGLKITRAHAGCDGESGYWQRFVAGRQLGVTCILQADRARIVGATRSLAAKDWPGPSEFIYRGSIGPVQLKEEIEYQLIELCVHLSKDLGFSGLLQFDFIQDDEGHLWLLECNPRWTAGMEILLRPSVGGSRSLVVDAVIDNDALWNSATATSICSYAKAVVYAHKTLHLSGSVVEELMRQSQEDTNGTTWLADIPYGAQTIERGHPIATVRTRLQASSELMDEDAVFDQLLKQLRSCSARLLKLIGVSESDFSGEAQASFQGIENTH